MLAAYLTTDAVNEALALQMAEESGVTVCPWSPRQAAPNGEVDAVLYDWDHLPAQRQQEVLAELLAGRASHPVAVHSYNLAEHHKAALRRRGVAVYGSLQPEVFWLLRLAAGYG